MTLLTLFHGAATAIIVTGEFSNSPAGLTTGSASSARYRSGPGGLTQGDAPDSGGYRSSPDDGTTSEPSR